MGMYTEIFFRAEVNEYAFTVLNAIIDNPNDDSVRRAGDGDGHPFFSKPRADMVFAGSSAYFPDANHRLVQTTYGDARCVSFRANLKNYDGEIESFFDWVSPHVKDWGKRTFIGYSLYEEDTEPTLYYTRNGS